MGDFNKCRGPVVKNFIFPLLVDGYNMVENSGDLTVTDPSDRGGIGNAAD